MAVKDNKPWVVVDTTKSGEDGVWHVRGKGEANRLVRLILGLGGSTHIYPEGYYPDFNSDGELE